MRRYLVVLAILAILTPVTAKAQGACGQQTDCIGMHVYVRCINFGHPPLHDNMSVLLIDANDGSQFEYHLDRAQLEPYYILYVASAGGLNVEHQYRAHLIDDGVYKGNWEGPQFPPYEYGWAYNLPDCPYDVLLPLVGGR